MKRITRIIRPIICMAVILFAMATVVMGCYLKDPDPIKDPSGTSEVEAPPSPPSTGRRSLPTPKAKTLTPWRGCISPARRWMIP